MPGSRKKQTNADVIDQNIGEDEQKNRSLPPELRVPGESAAGGADAADEERESEAEVERNDGLEGATGDVEHDLPYADTVRHSVEGTRDDGRDIDLDLDRGDPRPRSSGRGANP